MEISNEIKAKVFAQYSFQNLECVIKTGETWQQRSFLEEVELGYIKVSGKSFPYSRNVRHDEIKLILTPLSKIKDEDEMEISNIIGTATPLYFIASIFGTSSYVARTQRTFAAYQFLQSKGYDLPQYLLGGKTLHESGLAIYP